MRSATFITSVGLLTVLSACATPAPPPASHVTPPFNLRYVSAEPSAKKTVCVDVDATVAGGPARATRFRTPIVEQFTARGFSVVEKCQSAFVKITYTIPARFVAAVTSKGQPVFTEGASTTASMGIEQASSIVNAGYPASWALPSLLTAFGALQKDAVENRRQEPYYVTIGDLSVQVGDREPQVTQVRAVVPFRSMANSRDSRELTNLVTREVASTIVRVFAP